LAAWSASAIRAESYSFIWQPYVLMNSVFKRADLEGRRTPPEKLALHPPLSR
jgi:hypothetical protein